MEDKLKVGKSFRTYRRECRKIELVRVQRLEDVVCAREYDRAVNEKF